MECVGSGHVILVLIVPSPQTRHSTEMGENRRASLVVAGWMEMEGNAAEEDSNGRRYNIRINLPHPWRVYSQDWTVCTIPYLNVTPAQSG